MNPKISLLLKGMAMGAADVVPGVSGGTIAFITGIYGDLIGSLKAFDGTAIKLLTGLKLKEFWSHINGNFLIILFSGIAISILSLSRGILYLLQNEPILLWSFFFGLIVASSFAVGRKVKSWSILPVIAIVVGAAAAFYITMATPAETPEALWFIFLSGSIAICAMILPGISGSFILVLLAKYEYIFTALKDLDFKVIGVFIAGCMVGLLSFANLLNFLLKRYFDITVAVLTGFMIGSLNKVWPWKETVETYFDRHGEEKPLIENNIMPHTFEQLTGLDSQLIFAIVLAILGMLVVFLIEKYAPVEDAEEI